MAAKSVLKPIDTAFGILFLLLLAVSVLHVNTVAEMSDGNASAAWQITAELERFRALERDLDNGIAYLNIDSMDSDSKLVILDLELKNVEATLRELGSSGTKVAGLTRLVEPFAHVRAAREKIRTEPDHAAALLGVGGPLDRALQATLFVVRNNITRLGDEQSATTKLMNGLSVRGKQVAIFGGLAAVMVFVPVRLMAGRAAAKPIRALKAATLAVADEHWTAPTIDCQSDDAVGELVSAFSTMASKLKEARVERATSFQHTLAALVQTIEAKDAFTSNHSCNVAKFAELLARAIDLPEQQVKEIAYGGLLHDVGKIGIPDEIINKPGKLTDEEFSTIKQHPVIGDRIVRPLDGSEVLLPQVRSHHEHWDGKGYPDGLRGEQIPLSARVITVADVFDALMSDRPYRAKMKIEKAIAIMRAESGTTFDPDLVEPFIEKVVPQIRHILEDSPEKDASQAPEAENQLAKVQHSQSI